MILNRRNWNRVNYPIRAGDPLPAERKVVLVWCGGTESDAIYLPYLGYIRYAAGDLESPFFVVYHDNRDLPVDVIAWCDCLPDKGPEWSDKTNLYDCDQPIGRGFPACKHKKGNRRRYLKDAD